VEFVNEFTVPVGVDRAFEILTDLERVAPCLPGATLEEVDGDAYTGKVKVKVGPIAVTYRGTAEVTAKDAAAKHAVIHATGKEARGAGTAAADVAADLIADGADSTRVKVTTDLTVTGKPAQFGRGVMAEVGTKLIDTFADRLAAMIEADEGGSAEASAATISGPAAVSGDALPPATEAPRADTLPGPPPITPAAGMGPRRIAPPAQEPEALDLMEVAGGAITKRLLPVAGLVAVVLALLWWRRRSG
jgi:uncharacterized protein